MLTTHGMKILFEITETNDLYLKIPKWITKKLGRFVMMEFDGETLSIWSVDDKIEPAVI